MALQVTHVVLTRPMSAGFTVWELMELKETSQDYLLPPTHCFPEAQNSPETCSGPQGHLVALPGPGQDARLLTLHPSHCS